MRLLWLFLTLMVAVALPAQAAPKTPAPSASPAKEGELTPEIPAAPARKLVPYEKLIAVLPPIPKGWAADKPDGSLTDSGDLHLSTARRSYYIPDGNSDDIPSASVTIIDSTNNDDFFDTDGGEWVNESTTEEGYDKRLMLNGMRAVEHYDKASKTASLSVFVARRFFVQIEITHQDPKELYTWFKQIDIKALSELK